MELTDKVAVVTGASSGIGEAACRALAHAGVTVVAVARRERLLEQLADSHPRIVARRADVTRLDDLTALAEFVEQRFGACHVLVNNAGARFPMRFTGPDDLPPVEAAIDTNFLGAVRAMAVFGDLLERSAPSRVVNVASVAGKIGVGSGGYTASKFALVGFTEAVRPAWLRRGVAVCQLNPGFVETPGFPQDDLRRTPLGRLLGRPDMVAAAIVELARSGARERTVPRWYRPIVVLRHVAAPLVWRAAGTIRR